MIPRFKCHYRSRVHYHITLCPPTSGSVFSLASKSILQFILLLRLHTYVAVMIQHNIWQLRFRGLLVCILVHNFLLFGIQFLCCKQINLDRCRSYLLPIITWFTWIQFFCCCQVLALHEAQQNHLSDLAGHIQLIQSYVSYRCSSMCT